MKINYAITAPKSTNIDSQISWIESELTELGPEKIKRLVDAAVSAQALSYAPYSNYYVGAAALTTSHKIYQGTNIERVSYSETIHAEESAIAAAILGGTAKDEGRRFLKAIAVSHKGASAPCAHCRQIMGEHCDNCLVIITDPTGNIRQVTSLNLLMPDPFTPTYLGIK